MFMSIRKFIHARPVDFGIGVMVFATFCHLFVAGAAQAQDPCAAVLQEAEKSYFAGDFGVAISLTTRCLNEGGLADSTAVWAYKLLGMTFLAKNDSTQAGQAIRNLLKRQPDYSADSLQYPPPFVKLVNRIKQQLITPQQPEQPQDPTLPGSNAKKSLKPWMAGGVLVGAAILVVLWPLR
jgi:hypothetical protein